MEKKINLDSFVLRFNTLGEAVIVFFM